MRLRSACLILIGCFAGLLGQTVSTEILGLVTDATGAVVPGAVVTINRLATGDVRSAVTNETGNYIFPLLDIGEYSVTCKAKGFKTEVRQGVVLRLQEKARLDFQMQVGDQVETIEIRGAPPSVEDGGRNVGTGDRIEAGYRVASQRAALRTTRHADAGRDVRRQPDRRRWAGSATPIPGQTVQIAANGQRDIQQHITMDGVVATDLASIQ